MQINKPKISNGLIIWATLLFFPLAIFLMIIRFMAHANVNHMRAKDYHVIASSLTWFWLVYSFIFYILASNDSSEDPFTGPEIWTLLVVFAVMMLVPAFIFLGLGNARKRKMEERYRLYQRLVLEQGIRDYNEISAITGIRYRNVEQDMRYLLALEALTGNGFEAAVASQADVQQTNNQAANENEEEYEDEEYEDEEYDDEEYEDEEKEEDTGPQTVVCRGCGSSVTLYPGETKPCEYCGNELHVK